MPEGFFRAGKVIFCRHTCRMARKMNAVCLKKHRADRVRWLCIQVLIVNALEKKPMLLFNTAAYHAAVGREAAMR